MRLHSGAPFWLLHDGLEEMGDAGTAPTPSSCDAVIIGAGITGALVADALSAEGLAVVILDRRAPACGSTAASTSLLSYEIDVPLVELSRMTGEPAAVRAYRLSHSSVHELEAIAASLPEPTGFSACPSICLATQRRHGRRLQEEAALRQRHGLDAEYWTAAQVRQSYGFPSYGAIYTRTAGVLDPVRLTRALLARSTGRGAVLRSRTPARDVRQPRTGGGLAVSTDSGEIRARWVIYAMGYEMPPALRSGMVALHSTYALVTEPLEDLGPWKGGCIVWETARPYAYMRATEDCRVMIGGADMPFKDAAWRDRFMPDRTRRLEKQIRKWLPGVETQTAFTWAGTFGETRDGLPYIGPMPDCPQALYALGYGANGITFGAIAARIVTDLCMGRRNDDVELFRLDR
jgi:glycine/D-amino acid oxidase-like deaminating enzyme